MRVTDNETTLSPSPSLRNRTSNGAAVAVPAVASESLKPSSALSSSATNSAKGMPRRPAAPAGTMAPKARLHSLIRPSRSSMAMPMGASSNSLWKRCSEWRRTCSSSRSGERSRTTERVRRPPSSSMTVWVM